MTFGEKKAMEQRECLGGANSVVDGQTVRSITAYFLPPMMHVRAFSPLLSLIDDGSIGGGAFIFVCKDIVWEVST
jgi:hypothetical protein